MARTDRMRRGGLAVAAIGLLAAGCNGSGGQQAFPIPTTAPPNPTIAPTGTQASAPAQADERRPQRVSFLKRAETCERFAEAIRPVALADVGPYGFNSGGYGVATDAMATTAAAPAAAEGGQRSAAAAIPKAPQAGVDFSDTNVQEAGVDEPDLVKTDGRLLVTTADRRLRVMDVTGAPRLLGVLDLAEDAAGNLLLVGNRAMVLSSIRYGLLADGPATRREGDQLVPRRPITKVTVVDLTDPAKPRVVRTHTIDGSLIDARLIGGVARIVTTSSPDIAFPQPAPTSQIAAEKAQAANAEIVRNAKPAAFLPKGASCADAYVPVEAAGVSTISVQSLDPAAEAPGAAVTVAGAQDGIVYASAARLFVSLAGGSRPGPMGPSRVKAPEDSRTAIHAFDISDPVKARYTGSGDVPGRLLNQFSMSEEGGMLRVATTLDGVGGPTPATVGPTGPADQATSAPAPRQSPPAPEAVQSPPAPEAVQSQSRVTVLRQAGEEWVETGAVDGLGKGERIYAVRFLGTTGYVVTFRQVDPLYVLDLRDPRAPKVTGELKITGYSAYLHPAGEGRLLGIGQEATDQGRREGTQVSLFDVANPAAPAKLAGAVLPGATSTAEYDHHAFLYWAATGLVVAPVASYVEGGEQGQDGRPFLGVVAFRVGDKSVKEAGRITHPGQSGIQRSLVVGGRLLTVSQVGLAANDLSTLADQGFLAFR